MKGKFILLSTFLLLFGSMSWFPTRAATYELQELLIKDQQVSFDQVKDGDIYAFNSGMYNYTKTNPQQDVPNLWLGGKIVADTWSAAKTALSVLTGLTSDNLFQLEAAPDQSHDGTTYPSFYLKHVDSGQYVYGNTSRNLGLTNDKTVATSFSFQSIANYPAAGGGMSQDFMNEQTLCLVHYEGTDVYFLGPAWNYGFAQYSKVANDCIPWNLFSTKKSKDVFANLKHLYDLVKNNSYSIGNDPGYYPEDKVNAFEQTRQAAETAIADQASTDDEYKAILDNLYTAYQDVEAAKTPVTEGYYNIVNAYPSFEKIQGVKKSLGVNNKHQLTWGNLNKKDPMQLFKITAISDTTFSIQNIGSQEFVNTRPSGSNNPGTSTTQITGQSIKLESGTSQFHISNIVDLADYRITGWSNGAGLSGLLICSNASASTPSVWYLNKVTDQTLIDSLTKAGPQTLLAKNLQMALDTANTTLNKANDYTALLTKGEQITANSVSYADSGADPFTNLIDGNTATEFNSIWSTSFQPTGITEGTGWHNLQFNLPYAVSKMKFTYIGRNSTTYADTPNDIVIFGTNDDNLGASTAAADSSSWTRITELNKGFAFVYMPLAPYSSPVIDLGGSYKYLRFVIQNTNNVGMTAARTFGTPEVTGVTFNLSELQLYDAVPSKLSEYYTVTGMKEACDALSALIATAQDKMAKGTATQADIDALKSACAAINALYIDRDALDNQLAAALDSANNLYANVNPSKVTLITSADQISSNSMSNNDGSAYANLIDGDLTTVFHSHWDDAMALQTTTAESWTAVQEAWVTANTENVAVGIGYHNLQIKLTQPVSKFYFSMTGRGDTDYHDTPNDIVIYATNDDALGASTDEAELPQWTNITELKDGFPADIRNAQYTSPEIDLGTAYKYVRFVVKGTTHMNTVAARTFVVPDITGVTFNLMEFQMYTGVDPQIVQYNYQTGMKEAADALKTLIDADSKIEKHTILTPEPINTLRDAINKVLALYADTTNFAALYSKYKLNADSSIVGEGIGFVKSQEAIDAFKTAITEARASVSLTQPSVPTINAATDKMNTAFATFMTQVGQIVPNQWYALISASTRAFAQNQPIFLGSTSIGDKLHIGGYPIESIDPKGDPYATWRFVPIQGVEGQYAIQSMGTGQYFGAYRGDGSDASPLMSHQKAAYKLQYYGNGKFKIIQANVKNDMDALKTDGTNNIVLNWPSNGDNQQTWKFEAVSSTTEMSFNTMADNNIRIMTLPFELKGDLSIMSINAGIAKTYAIKYIKVSDTGTELGLKLKNDFEAGEPFIMTVNDYTKYDPAAASQPLSLAVPADVVDTSKVTPNGLIGTLQGMSVSAPGMGIFTEAKLKATTGAVTIEGRNGYINPRLVVNEDGDADLIIGSTDKITLVNSVVLAKATDRVNVYTIDGKLLKKNIKATEAQKNLNKGIYIIGKNKVAIK